MKQLRRMAAESYVLNQRYKARSKSLSGRDGFAESPFSGGKKAGHSPPLSSSHRDIYRSIFLLRSAGRAAERSSDETMRSDFTRKCWFPPQMADRSAPSREAMEGTKGTPRKVQTPAITSAGSLTKGLVFYLVHPSSAAHQPIALGFQDLAPQQG